MKRYRVGIAGVIVGLLALAAAFLSPWIVDMLTPPKPVETEVVDLATRLKDAAVAKLKGVAYQPPPPPPPKDAGDYVPPTVIGLGLLGLGLGVVSLIRNERRTVGICAIGLGLGAAVVQWSLLIVGLIVMALLVVAVLHFLDLDLGTG